MLFAVLLTNNNIGNSVSQLTIHSSSHYSVTGESTRDRAPLQSLQTNNLRVEKGKKVLEVFQGPQDIRHSHRKAVNGVRR